MNSEVNDPLDSSETGMKKETSACFEKPSVFFFFFFVREVNEGHPKSHLNDNYRRFYLTRQLGAVVRRVKVSNRRDLRFVSASPCNAAYLPREDTNYWHTMVIT